METKDKILIIDDEEIILDSCTQILASGNYQVATAGNGILGLQLAKEFNPDVIFVDLKMPGISGFEVIDGVHAYDPTIVAVVITGYATVNSAVEAMKKGAFDFLPKPFTPDELRIITRRSLERRKLVLETMRLRKEKEMLRDQFAAIVSHELKSPLSSVQQNIYILIEELSEILNPTQKDRLVRVQNRLSDLIALINTWLRILSVDISKIQENFKPVLVSSVIEKAVESVQTHAIRKDIELVVSTNYAAAQVFGDEGTLVESIINILGNAIKYSHMSSKVDVTVSRMDEEVCISVADRGVGISQEDLPHIFEDFYRGQTTSVKEQGAGIGLAITRRIIEAHHGTISVESVPGKGSTFLIRLPVLEE